MVNWTKIKPNLINAKQCENISLFIYQINFCQMSNDNNDWFWEKIFIGRKKYERNPLMMQILPIKYIQINKKCKREMSSKICLSSVALWISDNDDRFTHVKLQNNSLPRTAHHWIIPNIVKLKTERCLNIRRIYMQNLSFGFLFYPFVGSHVFWQR